MYDFRTRNALKTFAEMSYSLRSGSDPKNGSYIMPVTFTRAPRSREGCTPKSMFTPFNAFNTFLIV